MMVVKLGGNALANMSDLGWIGVMASRISAGERFVLVHGGGPQIDSELALHGVSRRFVDGLRYTDEQTYGVVEMVLAGSVQQQLVRILRSHGLTAVGLTGNDGNLITATRRSSTSGEDIGQVGVPAAIEPRVITTLVDAGFLPVISPTSGNAEGIGFNVNADLAAAAIAGALAAECVIFMTDVEGIYRDYPNRESLISQISLEDLVKMKEGFTGGMIPKVEAVIEAITAGAREASVIDGRSGEALTALLSGQPIGTLVTRG